jgi:hypothetical protein
MEKKSFYPINGGMNAYLPRWEIKPNEWSYAHNVSFGPGGVKKTGGWKKFFTDPLDGAVAHMDNFYNTLGDGFLLLHTPTSVYSYSSGSAAPSKIGEGLAGDPEYSIMSENAQDLYVFTNQIDRMKMWDGTNAVKDFPGLVAHPAFVASHLYEQGDCITEGGKNYICSVGGTSGTEPTWPDSGNVSSGGTTWAFIGLAGLQDGGDSMEKCRCLVNFNGFLIVGNTTEDGINYPQRIRWSQIGNSFKWKNDSNGSGQAGYADITDGVDWVQNMRSLSNYLVVYKERSIHILSYVGGDMVFEKRPSIQGIGLISPRAILDLGDEHIFIGWDNIYSFNLMEPKIAGDNIAKEFFRLLDPEHISTINNFFIEEVPEAYFTFTSINSPDGNPDMALVYNTDTKAWSIRELPMTSFGFWLSTTDESWDTDEDEWDADNSSWDDSKNTSNSPINLCGDANGYIYVFEGHSKDGADLACYLETGLIAFEDPTLLKRLKRIQFMVSREGGYGLDVQIGMCGNVEDDIVWYGAGNVEGGLPYQMSLDKTSPPWLDCDLTGRYFLVRMGTDLKNEPFELSGFIMYYEPRSEL